MEVLIIAGIVLSIAVLRISSYALMTSKINRLLKAISKEYGLHFTKDNIITRPEVTGKINNYKISIKRKVLPNRFYTRYFITILINFPDITTGHLIIISKPPLNPEKIKSRPDNVKTGDYRFDIDLYIYTSNPDQVLSLMNADNRASIHYLNRNTRAFQIYNSSLYMMQEIVHRYSLSSALKLIERLMSFVNNFNDKRDTKERLIENMHSDPLTEVRIQNIRSLIHFFDIDKGIRQALKESLNDSSIQVQIEAAKHLGQTGMRHLKKLIEKMNITDPKELHRIILLLGKSEFSSCMPAFKNLYINSNNEKIKTEILNALREFGDTSMNNFLMEELHSSNTDIKILIIKAFETCGTVKSVEPLFKIGSKSINPFIKNAANNSISKIQERLGNVDKGWLSISELSESDGALSIQENADKGALSLDEDNKKN